MPVRFFVGYWLLVNLQCSAVFESADFAANGSDKPRGFVLRFAIGNATGIAFTLREKGCVVKGMVAIFTYGLQVAADNFKNEKVELVTLTDYDTLIGVAKERDYIRPEAFESLAFWRENPEKWSDDHMN